MEQVVTGCGTAAQATTDRIVKSESPHPAEGRTAGFIQREIRICAACGTKFSSTSKNWFCPVCALLRAAGRDEALTEALDSAPYSELGSTETGPRSRTTPGLHAPGIVSRFENYEVMLDQDGNPIELGRGAMGVTYKAFDVDLRFSVVLKVINEKYVGDESARLRFLREARAAARVRHPNVASVFRLVKSSGVYFYAMEFVEGETLESLIRRKGRLEVSLTLEIASQVAAGLSAVYEENLVHRDIKPSNIMVRLWEDGQVTAKIIDLGLAKGVSEPESESVISIPGAFAGTPQFASPEQFAGLGLDIRSDLYSLGITLWEMLSGHAPFGGAAAELMYQHQHATPPTEKLIGIPAPVIALLEVLLNKDPNQRFQTPAQLQKALAAVRGAIGSGSQLMADVLRSAGDRATEKLRKAKQKKQPIRWVIVAGFCFVGALIAWFVFSGHAEFLFNERGTKTVPTEKSIAVLPFENISPDKDDGYFADGVQDEILNNLAEVTQLKVISRTSVMQYRGDNKRDLRQIAAALGVANVLEGTVRRDQNHVRVSTELVDAGNDTTIWADSYDRDLTDIFAIQSEIAQQVASRLSAQLSSGERENIEEKPTSNLEAYDLYLQARQMLRSAYPRSIFKERCLNTIALTEQAIQRDPKFALAYCWLAHIHDLLYRNRLDHTAERLALGDAAVNEALRLRPGLAEVHLAMAWHLWDCYRDIERARVQIAIATKVLPNDPDLLRLTASIDQVQGRWDDSTAGLERSVTLDPLNSGLLLSLADNYWFRRHYRDANRIYDRLIDLSPHQPLYPWMKAESTFEQKGDVTGVRAACEALPFSIKDDPGFIVNRVSYAMYARDFAAAKEIVSKSPNEEIFLGGAFGGADVPRQVYSLWLEFIQGNRPATEEFGAAREQLNRKVEADPTNPFLMSALALTDVALGRKEESINEARHAMEMRPISEDACDGSEIAKYAALVYVWAGQSDAAFEQLSRLVKIPSGLTYGFLKTTPELDPLRKDPRFDKLIAVLTPHE